MEAYAKEVVIKTYSMIGGECAGEEGHDPFGNEGSCVAISSVHWIQGAGGI